MRNGTPSVYDKDTLKFKQCCDCGLVHMVLTEINGKKVTQYGYRDDHETDLMRKQLGIVLYRRKNKK